ncbi:MAG: flippase-like domain-containing protein [Gammaproteobacteria bacterium]|jgi:uncharacterized protein (TIRG00374 family)|nr:flippase-like domain-containing protein [Gammaproteobacteria bacterium]
MKLSFRVVAQSALTAIFGFAVVRFISSGQESFQFLANTDWFVLLPVFALGIGTFALSALRFQLVANGASHQISFAESFRHVVIARFLNKLIPQSGWVFKARAMRQSKGMKLGEFASTFGAFVWLDLLMTTVVATVLLLIFDPGIEVENVKVLFLLLVLLAFEVIITVMALVVPSPKMEEGGFSPISDLIRRTAKMVQDLMALVANRRLSQGGAVIILVGILVSVVRMNLLFAMVGVHPGIVPLALFVAVNRLSNIVVITPGNVGIVEALFGVLAASLGIGGAQGVAVALVLRGSVLLTLAGLTLLLVASSKLRGLATTPGLG